MASQTAETARPRSRIDTGRPGPSSQVGLERDEIQPGRPAFVRWVRDSWAALGGDAELPRNLTADQLNRPAVLSWAGSPERRNYMGRRNNILGFASFFLGLLIVAGVIAMPDRGDPRYWASGLAGMSAIGLAWCFMPYWADRRAYKQRRRLTAAFRVDYALYQLCHDPKTSSGNLPLAKVWDLNRRQLDEYQQISKRQQQSAFAAALAASVVGFLVLVGGVLLAVNVPAGTDKTVVAALTGLGTAVSAYLGHTFLEMHKTSVHQLNKFAAEPHLTGQVLAAERLVKALIDEPGSAHAASILQALLRLPPGDDDEIAADDLTTGKGEMT